MDRFGRRDALSTALSAGTVFFAGCSFLQGESGVDLHVSNELDDTVDGAVEITHEEDDEQVYRTDFSLYSGEDVHLQNVVPYDSGEHTLFVTTERFSARTQFHTEETTGILSVAVDIRTDRIAFSEVVA